jgi:hypothetical protein
MALIICRECKNQVSDQAKSCPNCGVKVKKESGGFTIWILSAFIIFMIFMIAGQHKNNTPEGKAQLKLEKMIEICWSDYNQKSLSSEAKRMIAATCENFEAKYLAEYGRKP